MTTVSSPPQIETYVSSLGGKRTIRKILIANNGIAAVKAIRSIRRWAYETFGDERAVLFVSMATPEDVAANAEYVRMADIWTSVPGGANNRNFANVALIADIALRFKCEAVWAGWGHASENPALPAALSKLGIAFLGPPPDSMHALGDKIASTIIAQSAGVPTVAWSGVGLTVNYAEAGNVPPEVYREACITDADHARRVAEECGYPLVVKASEGGGGKGIRVVFDDTAICSAYRQVAAEVPGSPIFLMRLVQNARHLEVQIVADEYGDALALYGRDCSVQRRHQKIIEEGPVVAAPPHVWKDLERAAVALAKEVGYIGAGTVEYLYKGDPSGGEFYFLELNPRLQVEHPVTEWITGVNLPALQLHIGMGIPLRNVATIRKFLGLPDSLTSRGGTPMKSPVQSLQAPLQTESFADELEPLHLSPVPPQGHVIACRVTAENPDEGFQPTSGAIQELTFRNTPNVWGYFSVGASGGVHEYADSQFGHLFAWGETREASRRCLVLALKELSIRGDIRTTVEYLIKLLEMDAFRENDINTSWLDSLIAEKVVAEKPPTDLAVLTGAVCRAHMDFSQRAETFTKCLERGQLPPLDSSLVKFPIELIYDDVKYSFDVTRSDASAFRVRLAGDRGETSAHSKSVLAEIRTLADGAKLVLADGRSHVCYAREEPSGLRLSIDGKTCLFPHEYDPTTLLSSVSGKLVRYLVSTNDHVKVNQPYVELEVMKMYLSLSAPESGKISLVAPEGSSVEVGRVIARLDLDDPSKVRRAELFKGSLPDFDDPQVRGLKPHQQFLSAEKEVQLLLRGFDARRSAIEDLMSCIDNINVCVGEIREALSSLIGRAPTSFTDGVESELKKLCERWQVDEQSGAGGDFNGSFSLQAAADTSTKDRWSEKVRSVSDSMANITRMCLGVAEASELRDTAARYSNGSVLATTASSLLEEYLLIEKHFARRSGSAADALFSLRDGNKNDLSSVVEIAASHVRLKEKNNAIISLLEALGRPAPSAVLSEDNPQTAEFKGKLLQLSQIYAPEYADVTLRARIMLADLRRPHFQQRKSSVWRMLEEVSKIREEQGDGSLENLVAVSESILDVLVSFLLPTDSHRITETARELVAKVHILRSYRAYQVEDLVVSPGFGLRGTLRAEWLFRFIKREDGSSSASSSRISSGRRSGNPLSRGLKSFDSADNLAQAPGGAERVDDEPFRHGFLVAFENWAAMESEFDSLLEGHASSNDWSSAREVNVMTVLLRWDSTAPLLSCESSLRSPASPKADSRDGGRDPFLTEASVSRSLSEFCRAKESRKTLATLCKIKSITFIVAPSPANESVTYPGFYTFRVKNSFEEDPIYRHIDPPMAFQLELWRLSNFSISRFGYPTRSVHVFFAQDKTAPRRGTDMPSSKNGRPPLAESSPRIDVKPKEGTAFAKSSDVPIVQANGSPSKPGVDVRRKPGGPDKDLDARIFVRAVIRQADVFSSPKDGTVVTMPEAERTFVEALDAVELANCDRRHGRRDFNHVFLNVVPSVPIDIEDVESICRRMFQRYATRCLSLKVFAVEIKVSTLVTQAGEPPSVIPLRFKLFNPTGHVLKVETYVESVDPNTGLEKLLSVSNDHGSQHGCLVTKPYPIMDRIQRKRVVAQAMETTYVYDFLHIFARQLQQVWRRYSEDRLLGGFHRHKIPISLVESTELILSNLDNFSAGLVETGRQPGQNDVGVVVWRCLLKTPEYPNGRDVIIIANDITFRSGSFGPEEDALFCAASKLARKLGIPRIYLAANSGARIGVAEEIREKLEVDWVDPSAPSKGFRRLCIKEEDVGSLSSSIEVGEKLGGGMQELTDIIGSEHGLGVENLMGSGLLAGETSRAYDEIFTITYVCSRSVGIGAYLVRLGQRVIQKEVGAPIILTGHSALNKVLGHEVYISNDQLGGTKVMHPNGVSHSVVKDDVEGIGSILQWLSYVPKSKGDVLPIIESRDPVSRQVGIRPPENGQPYDPRAYLIAGKLGSRGAQKCFFSGMFDKDSWKEYLEGWAKTVVVGRARLGGVPSGIIAVETRSVEKLTPADPASPDTRETIVTQAGQVWYPDSAAKTAQAIRDFDREGLPLFILANWRGFSGGMRDMFDEILKPGSLIVDALRSYNQPVFVYIPPGGELRGGAWVVLDTLINPAMIEMYADRTCRGGVLEPEGTVDVKYRRRHIIKTMHRLDPVLKSLDQELTGGKHAGGIHNDERKQAIHEAIYAREVEMLPTYRNVATAFCDLHDTPGRMLAKGAVRGIVDWENARTFFYWRLQRRLVEERVRRKIRSADPTLNAEDIDGLLRKWAADYHVETGVNGHAESTNDLEIGGEGESWSFAADDKWVLHWLEVEEDVLEKRIEKIRASKLSAKVAAISFDSNEGFLNGIETALRNCQSKNERAELSNAIQAKISLVNSTRTPSFSSSLGLLSRLGKLGWERESSDTGDGNVR